MYLLRRQLCLMALVLSSVAAANAETHTFDIYNPRIGLIPTTAINGFDLNVRLVGITDVSVRVVGTGGSGKFDCPGTTPDGWYDLDVKLEVANRWFEFSTSNQVAFDLSPGVVDIIPGPWIACEDVPTCVLHATSYAHGTDLFNPCDAIEITLPEITHVEVTITADSIVSTSEVSWGVVKGMY